MCFAIEIVLTMFTGLFNSDVSTIDCTEYSRNIRLLLPLFHICACFRRSNPAETEPLARVALPNLEIIPSISSPLHCKLREMMSLWEKLYPSTRQDHGLKVFRKLLQMPLESLPTFEVKFSKMPTAAHLFRDLFADDDLQYKVA